MVVVVVVSYSYSAVCKDNIKFNVDVHSTKDIEDLMEESKKMQRFQHSNVLNLIGVCIDSGEAPYIIMPYMANGSLLTYLRKERPQLTIAEEAGEDPVSRTYLSLENILIHSLDVLPTNTCTDCRCSAKVAVDMSADC